MTNEQIEYMVGRFLSWKLPDNFNPDGGINFDATLNKGSAFERRREPVGTNLFDYQQAKSMVRYMLDGLPAAKPPEGAPEIPPTLEEAHTALRVMATESRNTEAFITLSAYLNRA